MDPQQVDFVLQLIAQKVSIVAALSDHRQVPATSSSITPIRVTETNCIVVCCSLYLRNQNFRIEGVILSLSAELTDMFVANMRRDEISTAQS